MMVTRFRFQSFSKIQNNRSIPDELFLSDDKTCRDFLSRDAARAFSIRRSKRFLHWIFIRFRV